MSARPALRSQTPPGLRLSAAEVPCRANVVGCCTRRVGFAVAILGLLALRPRRQAAAS